MLTMLTAQLLSDTKQKMSETIRKFESDLGHIRTGRAQSSILDGINVDYFGSRMPLKQVASIKTPDASLIMIEPWDKNLLKDIDKAIVTANLGFNPTNDGSVIRISVPLLTEERRRELSKQISTLAEATRITLRNIRKDAWDKVQKAQKESQISEDEKYRAEADFNKIIDDYNKQIEEKMKSKEKEVMEI